MFTWRHLLWLVICAGMVFMIVRYYNKKGPGLSKVLTSALVVAVASEITKDMGVIELVPSSSGELLRPYLPLNHLPLHFCSIQVVLIAVAKLTGMRRDERLCWPLWHRPAY